MLLHCLQMDKFFSLLGKLLVVVGIVGILVGGGYYLGARFTKPSVAPPSSPTASAVLPTSATTSPAASPSSSQATGRFTVTAGGIKPFSAYMLSGVAGWTQTKTQDATMSKLVLSKGDYSVTILQGAFGGGGCTFPGDQPQAMSVQLTSSVMIPLLTGNPLRRGQTQSPNASQANFTVCQKTADGSYGTITDFGAINYVTPLNPVSETLAEMDAMIGSLQKQ